jgi:type II secretory pathway component GspD/PulD (secretin)
MGTQIVSPFAEGNPLLFIPQANTGTIFIVSTPYLIERALTVFEDLDTGSMDRKDLASRGLTVFLYALQHKKGDDFIVSIEDLSKELTKQGASQKLIDCLSGAKWIKESNSILFLADNDTLAKLKDLLPTLDTAATPASLPSPKSNFFVYKIKFTDPELLQESLDRMIVDLQKAPQPDYNLIDAITSLNYIADAHSFIFTGDSASLGRLGDILAVFDVQTENNQAFQFLTYNPKFRTGEELKKSLQEIVSNLATAGRGDPMLSQTVNTAQWNPVSNALIFSGAPDTLARVQTLLTSLDDSKDAPTGIGTRSFFVFKLQNASGGTVIEGLKKVADNLKESHAANKALIVSLQEAKWIKDNNSILLTGTPTVLEQVKTLIQEFDVSSSSFSAGSKSAFFIYKPVYLSPDAIESSIKSLGKDLSTAGLVDTDLITTIETMKVVESTRSLLFTGTADSLAKVKEVVERLDVASPAAAKKLEAPAPRGEGTGVSNFIVYTPRFVPGDELIAILDEFQQNLMAAGVTNHNLYETITSMKWVPRTCSLIVSGDPDSIARVEDLIKRFDVPSSDGSANLASIDTIQNTSFLIYKLQYHQGNEILAALKQIATDLTPGTAVGNQNLLNAINSLQWIRVTNSLLASGEGDTLSKLRDLVQNLDVPLKQVFIEVLVIETELTNTQNFGLQWGGKMQFLNKFAAGTGNFPLNSPNSLNAATAVGPGGTTQTFQGTGGLAGPPPSTNAIPFVNGFDLGVIGDIIMHKGRSFISLGSLVNALQTDSDSTIILNPKIITQDNQTSTIFVGSNIPFIGSLVTTNSQILSSSSNIEYRDIGFNLTVTPTIGNNDVVTLDISNDISEQINQQSIGQTNVAGGITNITGIATSHTAMSTKVHVPDKHFVVLSGMIRDSKARFKSGIPCLGGLPVIGAVFSENDRINAKRNVIIFMRPHIVNTHADYKEITDHQETIYKNQASLPVLKEEFDAGVDVVKQDEDE